MSDEKMKLIRDNQWLCTSPYWQTQIKQRWKKTNWGPCCDYHVDVETNGRDDILKLKKLVESKQIDKKCWRCHNLEKTNGISERIRYLVDLPIEKIQTLISDPFSLNNLNFPPIISIKTTNTCNLACRSCSGSESTLYDKLFRDFRKNYNIWKDPQEEIVFKNYLFDQCQNNDEVMLHVLGGEVFLDNYIIDILNWCEQQKIINKIRLHITTNNQMQLERRLVNLSKKLKSIYLSLSIDSVGENYRYVRWPGKFSKIEKNMLSLENLRTGELSEKLTYSITPVFSLNNVFYIDDFINYWYEFAKNNNYFMLRIFNFHLHNPKKLMVENLPVEYRKNLISTFEKIISHELFKIMPDTKQFKYWIDITLNNLKINHFNDDRFNEYLDYTANYDVKTDQDSFILNSRLFDLLNDFHKNFYFERFDHYNRQNKKVIPVIEQL